jgi:ATP-binding cassette subfamily B protein
MELMSIGSVIPIIIALTDKSKLENYSSVQFMLDRAESITGLGVTPMVCIFFIFAAVTSSIFRFSLLSMQIDYAHKIGYKWIEGIYKKSLTANFDKLLALKKSDLVANLAVKGNQVVYLVLLPTFNILTTVVQILIIVTALIYLNPSQAISASFVIALAYLFVYKISKKRIVSCGIDINAMQGKLIALLNDTYGSIADLALNNTSHLVKKYRAVDQRIRRSQASLLKYGAAPRYFIEASALSMIAILIIASDNKSDILLSIGVIALASQKLLPLIQQFFQAVVTVKGASDCWMSLEKIYSDLRENQRSNQSIKENSTFIRELHLRDVTISRPQSNRPLLAGVNFSLKEKESLAIIGRSGSGKTSLLYVLLGLILPERGELIFNNKRMIEGLEDWQASVAYVPQKIFLIDGTIAENVAYSFNDSSINIKLVNKCLKMVGLDEFMVNSSDKSVYLGEDGAKLSGGQKQRVIIARALYQSKPVLVLDEATSALDEENEKNIINKIMQSDSISLLICVTHKQSVAKCFTKTINVENYKIH